MTKKKKHIENQQLYNTLEEKGYLMTREILEEESKDFFRYIEYLQNLNIEFEMIDNEFKLEIPYGMKVLSFKEFIKPIKDRILKFKQNKELTE